MYPNPQDALPLPSHPSVEQYRKLAKDLVKSCRSGDPAAIGIWASRWMEALAAHQREPDALRDRTEINARANQVDQFARTKLSGGEGASSRCVLADAQFVIARAHGFLSWPKFVKHIESLARASSPVSAFEAAADAIVTGDVATLNRLLREHPTLIRARSTREHRATLLHYVAANGVENYRQVISREHRGDYRRSCSRRAPTSTAKRTSTEVDVRLSASSPRVLLPPLPACSGR